MEDNKITITENGKDVTYDLIAVLRDDETGKRYFLYTDLSIPNFDVYAARYNQADGKIYYVDSPEEQKKIIDSYNELKEKLKNQEV